MAARSLSTTLPLLRAPLSAAAALTARAPSAAAYLPAVRRRTFLLDHLAPNPPVQTLRASRTLPHPPARIYDLISDVDSYASFLPYCQASVVTAWTAPDAATGRRWPARADLTVGFGPWTETYTSALYCVPGRVVEAVSGGGEPTIPREELARHGLLARSQEQAKVGGEEGKQAGVFESLVTRWTVAPAAGGKGEGEGTDVSLFIRFRFANPAYGLALASTGADVADMMAERFEERAKELFG